MATSIDDPVTSVGPMAPAVTFARHVSLAAALMIALGGVGFAGDQPHELLDDFSDLSVWQAVTSDGVEMKLSQDVGTSGEGMRIDFDFHGHGGWVAAVLPLALDVSGNFALSFDVRGDGPINQFEVKFSDASGENIWWKVYENFQFPREWTKKRIKRRHVRFAWGPTADQTLREISRIEFTIAACEGGKGSVWIDNLTLRRLPPDRPYDLQPLVTASSNSGADDLQSVLAPEPGAGWRSGSGDRSPWLLIDFLKPREYGGLAFDWDRRDFATDYRVLVSEDGRQWHTARQFAGGNGGHDYLVLPESESRFVKLEVHRASGNRGVALRRVEVLPIGFGESENRLLERAAKDARRGDYPKYLLGEQSFWTVIGVDGDTEEALMNQQGMIEFGRGQFSVEPFIEADGRLITWNDARCEPSLEGGCLPIPSVAWRGTPVELDVRAFADGEQGNSTLVARYNLSNKSGTPQRGALLLALRPLQVNPSWQSLNTVGGFAPLHALRFQPSSVLVNSQKVLTTCPAAEQRYAVTFDEGAAIACLRDGAGQGREQLEDPSGFASGVLRYPFLLEPGAEKTIWLSAPFHQGTDTRGADADFDEFQERYDRVTAAWEERLTGVELILPPDQEHIADTLKSTLAYILINRDGPGIQPGSRSYERSWIRDGALTSSALLSLGKADVVRDFLRWYAPYQFESGKVPCVVDRRGAEPVPENDSHGQLIYAIAEYHRFTGDEALLRELWPHVRAAVGYIQQLRALRMTDEYRHGDKRAFFGLVPESISHEGYSAKPMHSYWDDWFVLRGLKDAAYIASQLGEEEAAAEYVALSGAFREDLLNSLSQAMRQHGIDYLPGCVELGDFDATSTTVAVAPCGEIARLPRQALDRTFEKYWENFVARRDNTIGWDAYTPYELRVVGTLVRMGQRERAWQALDYFLQDRRPAEWNHWAEVVWRDPETPKFIGDMPHTWVGSDFIRSVLSMFAYSRENDQALVIGAGIPGEWLLHPGGVGIDRIHTYYGPLSFRMRREGKRIVVGISGELDIPPGGVVVIPPMEGPIKSVTINDQPGRASAEGVRLRVLPVELVVECGGQGQVEQP